MADYFLPSILATGALNDFSRTPDEERNSELVIHPGDAGTVPRDLPVMRFSASEEGTMGWYDAAAFVGRPPHMHPFKKKRKRHGRNR